MCVHVHVFCMPSIIMEVLYNSPKMGIQLGSVFFSLLFAALQIFQLNAERPPYLGNEHEQENSYIRMYVIAF